MALTTMKNLQQFLNRIAQAVYGRNFGMQGGTYIGTPNVIYTGRWQAIKANGNAGDPALRFTLLTTAAGDDMTGFRLNPGDILYGDFTEIRIDSLGVYAYFKS